MKKSLIVALITAAFSFANAAQTGSTTKPVGNPQQDVLVKFKSHAALSAFSRTVTFSTGAKIEALGVGNWARVQTPMTSAFSLANIAKNPNVEYVQPNYRLAPFVSPSLAQARAQAKAMIAKNPHIFDGLPDLSVRTDNPAIPSNVGTASTTTGADPLFAKQWGMNDIGTPAAHAIGRGKDVIVAVIDTGVDYTHEDLVENMWRNAGEIPDNKIDDDKNGYVDDIVGWDMVDNDNKPFDLAGSIIDIVLKGANPGHGTHCAGNVAARGNNGIGISGVAPEAKIMALRFIGAHSGSTADAVKAMVYAVQNGAKVMSNSWGSIGEDPADPVGNKALRDAITMTEEAGVLFVAAAGNGDPQTGVGYSNDDNVAKQSVPASYPQDSIISVAALDANNQLGKFSNWGATTVDIGAPGVAVFSTVVQTAKYTDTVLDFMGLKATWDGTSMATPHVAGAAALYWSKHPTATWREVKAALMTSAVPISSLTGKVVSGAKLNTANLMAR